MKRKINLIITAVTLTIFTSCASYNAQTLNTLSETMIESNNEITVIAKTFTKTDCDTYLDRDVISEGYQPIQLFIQNHSNKAYLFSLNRIDLPCARPEEVADKVHTSTVGRVAGYGAAAVAFGLFNLIGLAFAIPAVVDGIKSANANESLDNDFSSKAARDTIIAPHSYYNKLIFVPVNGFQNSFTVGLLESKTNKIKQLNVNTR